MEGGVIPSRNEHTIATSCDIQGRGYWSGQMVTVAIHPAPMGTGVRLVRSDLGGNDVCPANVDFRADASLRTNLECGTAKFQMVEHLMAALSGLEIDNCLVEIDAEELPALDGSSQGFVQKLRSAGLIVQARQRERLVIQDRYRIGSPAGWIEASLAKRGEKESPLVSLPFSIAPLPQATCSSLETSSRRFAMMNSWRVGVFLPM